MEKIIVNFVELPSNGKIKQYYINCFGDLYNDFGIKTYFYIKKGDFSLDELNLNYNNYGIFFDTYNTFNDFKTKVSDFVIVELTTFTENLIPTLIEYRKRLGFNYTKHENLFRDKNLQRDLLLKYDKSLTVNYKKFDSINKINIENVEKEFSYPFIIKPISGIQSQLVYKIDNRESFEEAKKSFINANKNHFNNLNKGNVEIEVLIEEFIDGEMYSMNYFVDNNGKIYYSRIVKVLSGQELGIKDFFNYNRLSGDYIDKELDGVDVRGFIEKNIKATGIEGTFIHHEFKLNSEGELKTIELNGRIGGYRLEMMSLGYDFNILRFMLGESMDLFTTKNNLSFFVVYAHKRSILKGFNMDLVEKVKSLK